MIGELVIDFILIEDGARLVMTKKTVEKERFIRRVSE